MRDDGTDHMASHRPLPLPLHLLAPRLKQGVHSADCVHLAEVAIMASFMMLMQMFIIIVIWQNSCSLNQRVVHCFLSIAGYVDIVYNYIYDGHHHHLSWSNFASILKSFF